MRVRKYVFYINIGEILRRTELNIDVDTLGYLSKMHQQISLLQFLNAFNTNEQDYEFVAVKGADTEVINSIEDFLKHVCLSNTMFMVRKKPPTPEQIRCYETEIFEWYNFSTILAQIGVIIGSYLNSVYKSELFIAFSYIFLLMMGRLAVDYTTYYYVWAAIAIMVVILRNLSYKKLSSDSMRVLYVTDWLVVMVALFFFCQNFAGLV